MNYKTTGNSIKTEHGHIHVAAGQSVSPDSVLFADGLASGAIVADEAAVNATQAAEVYAVENGIDLSDVIGTGKENKITLSDVKAVS